MLSTLLLAVLSCFAPDPGMSPAAAGDEQSAEAESDPAEASADTPSGGEASEGEASSDAASGEEASADEASSDEASADEVAIDEPALDYALSSPPPDATPQLAAPRLQVEAGAQLMTRTEFIRTRTVDGESSLQTIAPTRLRARLRAQARHLKLLAEFQDARILGDPIGAARMGFHQLFAAYETELARADLRLRVGRQEMDDATRHLYWSAPWGAAMRSFDALRLNVDFARGGLELFAGSLARPLLSSSQRLSDHVAGNVNLTWMTRGYLALHPAIAFDLYVSGAHVRTSAETRDITTEGLYLHGAPYPGLSYLVDARLQLGTIDRGANRQRHVAGAVFAKLDYLAPEGLGPEKRLKPGATVGLDFASGSKCTTTEFSGFGSCTDAGTSADFYAPWMARHAHFGRGDRFLSNNVIDGIAGVRLLHQATDDLNLELDVFNHLFAFPEPGGRWQNLGTAVIGVDPDNQNPWAADEIDVEATLRYKWLRVDLGWHLVNSLAGGRAVSGVRSWQRIYFELTALF